MKDFSALALSLTLIAACFSSGVPAYTAKVDQKDLPPGEAIVRIDVPHALSPETMGRLLLKEAARAAIDRGALYLEADEFAIGPVTSSTPKAPIDRTGMAYRTTNGMTSTEAAIEAAIVGLLSINIEKQRSGSLHFAFSREPMSGDHVFEASELLDAIREGAEVTSATP